MDKQQLMDAFISVGSHAPNGQFCALEWWSQVVGEPWTDHPEAISEVWGAWVRPTNDFLPDAERQRLKAYLPRMWGRNEPERDQALMFEMADWACRVIAPLALDAAGLADEASKLRALPPPTPPPPPSPTPPTPLAPPPPPTPPNNRFMTRFFVSWISCYPPHNTDDFEHRM